MPDLITSSYDAMPDIVIHFNGVGKLRGLQAHKTTGPDEGPSQRTPSTQGYWT